MPDKTPNLGATGVFPTGEKLRPDDEGELCTSITYNQEKNMVFIDFGKSIRWLAISPEDAKDLAVKLFQVAQRSES